MSTETQEGERSRRCSFLDTDFQKLSVKNIKYSKLMDGGVLALWDIETGI